MLRTLFLITTTGFWLTMMSLLIHKEFFQLTPIQTAYEVLPLYQTRMREEYQAIYLGEKRIGFGFTVLEAKQGEETGNYELRHQTYLSFLLLGYENEMLMKGKAQLDNQLYLKEFSIRVSSKDYWTEIKGIVSENTVDVEIQGLGAAPTTRKIPITGPLLYSESLDHIWTPENLKIGKSGRIQVWNPMTLDVEDIEFRVSHKENLTQKEGVVETYVVWVGREGIETRAWITPEGITLRKESPTGLLFEKQPSYEIFDAMRTERSKPADLPHIYSIHSNQVIAHPEQLQSLKVKIKTPKSEKIIETKRVDIKALPALTLPFDQDPLILENYTKPTDLIQSNDFEIKSLAADIVGEEKSILQAGLKIQNWVHQNMKPMPTVSLPSAKQVLQVRKGDCNEYTALYTALARAAGIPTRMQAGLMYYSGRFFYHAWPEIYIGEWVGIDPTLNQAPVDAAHIPIVEGDVPQQIALVSRIGQIKIFILETK